MTSRNSGYFFGPPCMLGVIIITVDCPPYSHKESTVGDRTFLVTDRCSCLERTLRASCLRIVLQSSGDLLVLSSQFFPEYFAVPAK